MKSTKRSNVAVRFLGLTLLLLANWNGTGAWAQKPGARVAEPQARVILAINEGEANADAAETLFKYEEIRQIIEKALRTPVVAVAVRDHNKLRGALRKREYALLLSHPNDAPAEAIRDFGYQPIVTAREPSQTLFIVHQNSPIRTITDIKGKTIVIADQHSNMWRVANAMLRDSRINMANEKVKPMRDQAAIGWSMENKFYDVGVVNSISEVGRNWEKNGGRVLAKSKELPNMPLIASPDISAAQVSNIRTTLVALESSEGGRTILKKVGLTGFRETSPQIFLEFLAWLGGA